MARIQLYVEQSLRTLAETALDAQNQQVALPFLRLFCLAAFGDLTLPIRETLIDTGAPLSLIPRVRWEQFENHIEWLKPTTEDPARSWVTRLRGRTGGESRCRLGRVLARAVDLRRPPRSLPPGPILAQFEDEEDFGEDRIITGLYGGLLQGRRLVLETNLRQAWLEER